MKFSIFREYDIRGIVGPEFKIDEIDNLTRAIITYFKQQNPKTNTIVLGRDGRTHSPEIREHIVRAATQLGVNVLDIGVCPTPVFYFTLFNTEHQSGMIITASHNPGEYNGLKMCLDKKSVWGKEIQKIREIYQFRTFDKTMAEIPGTVTEFDANTAYLNWLTDHFANLKGLDINAVVDCGNGAGGVIMPRLIKEMGWKNVKLLFEEVDGTFPNHEADPTKIANMRDAEKLLQEDDSLVVGLGLDGDCDRMNPLTKNGYLVPGDKMLALYSQKIIPNNPSACVVFDIKCSSGLIESLDKLGAKPHMAPSGHSIIKEHLYKNKALLAGELSCHFFFNDRYFGYDDGIYAALRLFELLHESKETLDELVAQLPKKINSHELRIPCTDALKNSVVEEVKAQFAKRKDAELIMIDGIRAQTKYGWGLIRVSNTQPAVCLRFESDTDEGLEQIKNDFRQAIDPYFETHLLEEHFDQ